MNLSDLGTASSGGSVSASATPPDPAAAISQGSSLFDSAYAKANGSITGTVAVAASVVSDLPAGQAKELLSTVLGIASAAAAGAAMGSVIPGWGTAVGAAVGAGMALMEDAFSSAGTPPEGDERSSAEQMCFPAIPDITPTDTTAADLLGEQYAQPVSWPDIRIHSAGYQPPFTGTDPATGQNCPVAFTFATGWISPPQTTPTSKQVAWYLAQAWLGRGSINKYWALSLAFDGPGDLGQRQSAVDAAKQQAGTLLGDDSLVTKALALVDRWYGTRWGNSGNPWAFNTSHCKGVNSNWGWTVENIPGGVPALPVFWQKMAQCLNQWNSLDYAYYFSERMMLARNVPNIGATTVGATSTLDPNVWVFSATGRYFAAMPDTTLVGLCELAALVVLGVLPEQGSDHVALHFVMALAWLWRRGQEKDKSLGQPFAITNHENFSRIIGLLAHHVKTTPQKAPTKKPTPKTTKKPASKSASKSSSSSSHAPTAATNRNRALLTNAARSQGLTPLGTGQFAAAPPAPSSARSSRRPGRTSARS